MRYCLVQFFGFGRTVESDKRGSVRMQPGIEVGDPAKSDLGQIDIVMFEQIFNETLGQIIIRFERSLQSA